MILWRIGHKPLLIDLFPEPGMDDDHVLALYRVDGRWGTVAKSNYVNLGFREPVYKYLRELVMTYFFYGRKSIPLISPRIAQRLNLVPDRLYAAKTIYTNLKQSFGNRKA